MPKNSTLRILVAIKEGFGLSENAETVKTQIQKITGKTIVFPGPQLPAYLIDIIGGNKEDIQKLEKAGYVITADNITSA